MNTEPPGSRPRVTPAALVHPVKRQGGPSLLILSLCLLSGCGSIKLGAKPSFLLNEKDAARLVRRAYLGENSDERRRAVTELARPKLMRLPSTVAALCNVARTDESESVRCAAVRALRSQPDAQTSETLLLLLGAGSGETGARLPGDQLRFEAIEALGHYSEKGALNRGQTQSLQEAAIRLLASDPSRDVRLASARLLGSFPTRRTLDALVAALGQTDYGVVFEAERSLTRLTGKSHNHEAAQWKTWLAQTDEPLARRAIVTKKPKGESGWMVTKWAAGAWTTSTKWFADGVKFLSFGKLDLQ